MARACCRVCSSVAWPLAPRLRLREHRPHSIKTSSQSSRGIARCVIVPEKSAPCLCFSYGETRPWAKAICKAAVLTRKMPPWFADPKFGHFLNDRRLKDSEINIPISFRGVDGGAPEGDVKTKPAPVEVDRWLGHTTRSGFPDAGPNYRAAATGTLEYIYIVIPTGFTKDTWVSAAEVRPGARSVVHHEIAVVRPPGSQWLKDAQPFVPYIPARTVSTGQPDPSNPQDTPVDMSWEFLAGYAPGMPAQQF